MENETAPPKEKMHAYLLRLDHSQFDYAKYGRHLVSSLILLNVTVFTVESEDSQVHIHHVW